jgi:hypothetical protein
MFVPKRPEPVYAPKGVLFQVLEHVQARQFFAAVRYFLSLRMKHGAGIRPPIIYLEELQKWQLAP